MQGKDEERERNEREKGIEKERVRERGAASEKLRNGERDRKKAQS